jgi:hypothetical protein
MRKIALTFTLTALSLVGIYSSADAQETENRITVQQVQDENAAQIGIDKDVHDYGTITQGDDGGCIFKITNTGKEPLIISLCKGSCGCTVPVCPQEPIAPGATADVSVKYNTNRVGPINKSVTITSNAGGEPRKVIRIKGNVKAKPQGTAPISTGGPTNN